MSIYEKAAAKGIRGSNLINIFSEKFFHHAAGVDIINSRGVVYHQDAGQQYTALP